MGKHKLKILTVNVSDASGGAARAAYRIHNAVKASGVESVFLVKNKALTDNSVIAVESFDRRNIFSNLSRYVVHKLKNKIQQARWNKYPLREDVFLSDLRSTSIHGVFQKIDFDILHLHWINLRFLDINELRKINKPIVWTLHDCWPFTGICHYFYECERYKTSCGNCPFLHSESENDLSTTVWKKKQQAYAGLNLHIVSPSNWLANAARESSLFGHFPISVIPNPIDTDYFTPGNKQKACEQLQLNPDKQYILFGAMNAVKDRNKGYEEFNQAINCYEQHFDCMNIELLIFGTNDKLDQTGFKMTTHNLGMLQDEALLAAYRAADVMVVPSLSENLSNVIMESLACGTPVVAFNIGGNSDMIDHKLNGFLAKAFDCNNLAEGIEWCLGNKDNINFQKISQDKVKFDFGLEKVANKYMNIYQKIYDTK
jgi:glycosyltransferase involved in cell wall biosynthesis